MATMFDIYNEARSELIVYLTSLGEEVDDLISWLEQKCCHVFEDDTRWVRAHDDIAGLWYVELEGAYTLCFVYLRTLTETLISIVSVIPGGAAEVGLGITWSVEQVQATNRAIRERIAV